MSATPFHGSYPGVVVIRPTDVQWTRAALFRELNTGWQIAERDVPWLDDLPAPLAANGRSLVITRRAPHDPDPLLALVSLYAGQREYYLIRQGAVVALHDVVWAEWHPQRAATLVAATSMGTLRLLRTSLDPVWEYDMNGLEPEPRDAPEWAMAW